VAELIHTIKLQESDEEGITDIELATKDGRPVAVFEAKIGGWPGPKQLSQYARYLGSHGTPGRMLVALGVPPHAPHLKGCKRIQGIPLFLLRWADVLGVVNEASRSARTYEEQVLLQLRHFIQEVIGMQSYDREVLVRDLKFRSRSYELFLEHNLYICQESERAEPLFFAPCFTGADVRVNNGIHYVGRVYYRHVIPFKEQDVVSEGLRAAKALVERQVAPLKKRKGAKDQVEYLDGLPAKWRKGFSLLARTKHRDTNAVFFLGDPIRLPVPLKKQGKMVPVGFSMTLERLMSADPGTFQC
jgi:hypothetical protein